MAHNIQEAARIFVKTWTGRGHERSESQSFWNQLLHDIFGVSIPANFIQYELPVHLKNQKYIDAYIPSTKVLIEQKSSTSDLRKSNRQSDKEELTPFEQAQRYAMGLEYSKRPRWIVTCNFKSFLIYDMEKPNFAPFEILLEDLEREYYLLKFLVEDTEQVLRHEKEISIKAGELIGKLYDEFQKRYVSCETKKAKESLNILCVRLVFCLFAEDSGLFGEEHGMFYNYLRSFKPSQMRKALIDLFKILNTPYDKRDPYEEESLAKFPYVNGGLFARNDIEIPNLTEEIANLLLNDCSAEFDWSGISPTIFGALFEDTMNSETREKGCMHYTSVENIHRVIDPLFLNDLKQELRRIMQIKANKLRKHELLRYQQKLASLTFLDPACGSGNFLTETYLSLRHLENEVLEIILQGNRMFGGELSPIKVSIEQFYGIEVNDFAVTVAKAALWIAEAQMMHETEHIVMRDLCFLPLRSYSHIERANALTTDWNNLIDAAKLSYMIGNPPFKGKKSRDENQKADLQYAIGKDCMHPGNLDIVTGWFFKAARYIQGTSIQVAFVSTINITRGEQVSLLWDSLLKNYGIKIMFAYKPFVWNSESKKKAQVHCTIIGFTAKDVKTHTIYSVSEAPQSVRAISPYIREENTILVHLRKTPLCEVPATGIGNKPIDGGYYLFTLEEKEDFIKKQPEAKKYFMEWYGADEIIKGKRRYFLWLAKCTPSELRKMPLCVERIYAVKEFRAKSSAESTRELANFPTSFHVTNIPDSDFIVIPEVSSENRDYIPMEYISKESATKKLFSNLVKLMPHATYYHFGILQSHVHMVWTKGVCGYKDYRPRYSTDIVFNNFPWPKPTKKQKEKIEETGKAILETRAKFASTPLKELYDRLTMPDELKKAHIKNDKAVSEAYGFTYNMPENEMIKALLELYSHISNSKTNEHKEI